MKIKHAFLLIVLHFSFAAGAQTGSQRESLLLTATAQASPVRITLNWTAQTGTTGYTVYRKLKTDASWGTSIGTAASSATSYQDNGVSVGTAYEYKVVRAYSGGTGYGYISSAINLPATDFRGKLVLLVDNTFITSCATQLTQLETDLKTDGWIVLRSNVDRNASVSSVRGTIQGYYNADPTNVKAVYIVGHVPVPYSGNINPDGHGDHLGAWPCDGYYGEMNGTWTDNSVNSNGGQNARNHNSPGDGKFDQSDYPSALELQVGRVDFYEFESFQYYAGLTETQLTINYLNKAHQFKAKLFTPTFRGCVFDNFDDLSYGFAGSGYRSISANVGTANLVDMNPNGSAFSTLIDDQSYLWTYVCGGGTWTTCANVGSTGEYANNIGMGGVFNMAFGSYFGDWNSYNNFLRAPLGSGKGLTNVAAGIPNWFFHHMGMGENIGYSTLASMNNTTMYVPQNPGWQGTPYSRVHMGLMGDPSLRQLMVAMPGNLQVTNNGGLASFAWNAATSVDGYYIYDMGASNGIPVRISPNVVTTTSFSSPSVPFVAGRKYMVRAVKLETAATGTFYNLSLGVLGTASGQASADCAGVVGGSATVGSPCNDNNSCTTSDVYNASCVCSGTPVSSSVTLTAYGPTSFCTGGGVLLGTSTGTGFTFQWKLNGNIISGATSSSYTATQGGSYTVTVNNGGCSGSSNAISTSVTAAPTAAISAGGATSFCTGGSVVLNANTGTGYTYTWKRDGTVISGATSSSYTATLAGSYIVSVSAGGCTTASSATTVSVGAGLSATLTASGNTGLCTGGSVVLNANTGTGLSYVWKRDGTVISGATSNSYTAAQAGSFTVTVGNGSCTGTSSPISVSISAAPSASITAGGSTSFCTGGSVTLSANTGTGLSYVWKRNGTVISGATSSSYATSLAGSHTVTVSNGGCSATSSAINVSVTAGPVATITAGGSVNLCTSGSVVLNASTGAGYTYVWKRSGTVITGATSSSITATLAGDYTVTITNGGCTAVSSALAVTSGTGAQAMLTAYGPTSFCTGGGVLLGANSAAGNTYVWKRSGTVIVGATGIQYTGTQTGSYTVTITNGGCTSVSNAINAVSSSTPSATINAAGALTFCEGKSVILNANTGTGLTYVWKRSGTVISGATSSSFTAVIAGSYTVVVSNGGCSTTSSAVSVATLPVPLASCSANNSAGTVSATATGGQPPYAYSWNTVPVQTSATASVPASGIYTISVTGGNGCFSSCAVEIDMPSSSACAGTRTESQATWGSAPSNGNPASYMATNFAAAFPAPNYLTIGCGSRQLRLTSAAAVNAFLPSSGTANRLNYGLLVDPGTSYLSQFAGELVALKLSVRFDELNPSFNPSTEQLQYMVIASGTFAGWNVASLIEEADKKIGGCSSPYTRASLKEAVLAVINGYAGGTNDSGFLLCPGGSRSMVTPDNVTVSYEELSVSAQPNPFHGSTSLVIKGLHTGARADVEIWTVEGTLMDRFSITGSSESAEQRVQWNAADHAAGLYICRVISGSRTVVNKMRVE